jgi:hypothetical protein
MNLEQIQRAFFEVTRQPLTSSQGIRPRLPDGRLTRKVASEFIKPNDRLTSQERLEIYNQQYWFRLLDCLTEDFPGLRSLIGERKFDKFAIAYLTDCPSESFTLRDLGSRLEAWLRKHRQFVRGVERLALDMVRLEWANVVAFDELELPRFTTDELGNLSGDTVFRLQPHLQLLALAYPVDELRFQIRSTEPQNDMVSNAVLEFPRRTGIRRSSLPKPQKVYLAVYRLQNTIYFKRLTRDAFALLRALGQGKPLAKSIEASLPRAANKVEHYREQLREWFENWSTLGWLAK